MQPENIAAWQGLIEMHALQSNWNELLTCADQLLRLLPPSEQAKTRAAHLRKAYAFERLTREREAIDEFTQFLVGAPKHTLPQSSSSWGTAKSNSSSTLPTSGAASASASSSSTSSSSTTSGAVTTSSPKVDDYSSDSTMNEFTARSHIVRIYEQWLKRVANTTKSAKPSSSSSSSSLRTSATSSSTSVVDNVDAIQRQLDEAREALIASCQVAGFAESYIETALLRHLQTMKKSSLVPLRNLRSRCLLLLAPSRPLSYG